jgi:hypothetical protein
MFDSLSKTGQKLFITFAVIFTLALSAMIAALFYQLGEIDALDYRAVRNAFKGGTPAFRMAVAQAISDGKIDRLEHRKLTQAALDDSRPLTIPTGYVNAAEERVLLSAIAKQIHQ